MEDQDAPATKGDIAALKGDMDALKDDMALKGDIALLDERIEQLRSEMNHGYRELQERLDDGITRMLKAFYNVAETHGKRLMDLESSDWLNLPPAA